mmetsp:Transcript_4363/g.11994  ORF Transcript_4363/g.11994 Transcript_4363/m.11994 type:complete len:143 (+) Transcript_4363:87-515(+)
MVEQGRDDCPICLRGLLCEDANGDMIPLGSAHPCGHCYHMECYRRLKETTQPFWGQPSCPTCRTSIRSFEHVFLSSQQTDVDTTVVTATAKEEQEDSSNAFGKAAWLVGGAVVAAVGFAAGFASAKSIAKEKKKKEEENEAR